MKTTRRALLAFLGSLPFLRKSKGQKHEQERIEEIGYHSHLNDAPKLTFTTDQDFHIGQIITVSIPGLDKEYHVIQVQTTWNKDSEEKTSSVTLEGTQTL